MYKAQDALIQWLRKMRDIKRRFPRRLLLTGVLNSPQGSDGYAPTVQAFNFKGCHIPTLFIITAASNTKYQCFKVTYQVSDPQIFYEFLLLLLSFYSPSYTHA